MDEDYLLATARYVELNPVRARLVRRPENWPWSSARAHLAGRDDGLIRVAPLLRRGPDWARFLAGGMSDDDIEQIRKHGRTGRPLGAKRFVERLERRRGRPLLPRKPGRKPKEAEKG